MAQRGFVSVSSSSAKGKRGLRPSLQVTIGTGQRCPFCHEHLDGDADPLVACAECLTVFHEGCVTEGGACTTMGCARSRPDARPEPPAPTPPAPAATRSPPSLATPAALVAALAAVGLVGWVALRTPTVVVVQPPAPVVQPPPPVVHTPPPPVIVREVVVAEGPRIELAHERVLTSGATFDVRGVIHADGPVDLTFSTALGGELTLRQAPGPFAGTVTVGPDPGEHEVLVRARDARGRETLAVLRVRWAP